jgi:hypothetical protein
MTKRRATTVVRCAECGLSFTTSDAPRAAAAGTCAFCGTAQLIVAPALGRLAGTARQTAFTSKRSRSPI